MKISTPSDWSKDHFDDKKFKLEAKNIKSEVKEEIINLDDLNDDLAENNQKSEPRELTTIFTCPMCFKKYASLTDLETHIAQYLGFWSHPKGLNLPIKNI
mgnify:CR=1 FL=1